MLSHCFPTTWRTWRKKKRSSSWPHIPLTLLDNFTGGEMNNNNKEEGLFFACFFAHLILPTWQQKKGKPNAICNCQEKCHENNWKLAWQRQPALEITLNWVTKGKKKFHTTHANKYLCVILLFFFLKTYHGGVEVLMAQNHGRRTVEIQHLL